MGKGEAKEVRKKEQLGKGKMLLFSLHLTLGNGLAL